VELFFNPGEHIVFRKYHAGRESGCGHP